MLNFDVCRGYGRVGRGRRMVVIRMAGVMLFLVIDGQSGGHVRDDQRDGEKYLRTVDALSGVHKNQKGLKDAERGGGNAIRKNRGRRR